MNPFIEYYGGRRFILTVLITILASMLVYANVIPPDIYRDIIIATTATYISANTYQKHSVNKYNGLGASSDESNKGS